MRALVDLTLPPEDCLTCFLSFFTIFLSAASSAVLVVFCWCRISINSFLVRYKQYPNTISPITGSKGDDNHLTQVDGSWERPDSLLSSSSQKDFEPVLLPACCWLSDCLFCEVACISVSFNVTRQNWQAELSRCTPIGAPIFSFAVNGKGDYPLFGFFFEAESAISSISLQAVSSWRAAK